LAILRHGSNFEVFSGVDYCKNLVNVLRWSVVLIGGGGCGNVTVKAKVDDDQNHTMFVSQR
jgi:hypothetical protein